MCLYGKSRNRIESKKSNRSSKSKKSNSKKSKKSKKSKERRPCREQGQVKGENARQEAQKETLPESVWVQNRKLRSLTKPVREDRLFFCRRPFLTPCIQSDVAAALNRAVANVRLPFSGRCCFKLT